MDHHGILKKYPNIIIVMEKKTEKKTIHPSIKLYYMNNRI